MNIKTRYLPLGALPYESVEPATRMMVKLFEKIPYCPFFSKIPADENLLSASLRKIPGVSVVDKKITFNPTAANFNPAFTKLDNAFSHPKKDLLAPYAMQSMFSEKFFNIIKKYESPNAIINIIGPYTLAQVLRSSVDEPIITDKNFRKLIIQAVSVKALATIEKIKESSPKTKPIVVLEENMLGGFGTIKRENEEITPELVTSVMARVVEKIKASGAIVAVRCNEKCDWQIPINAGVDMIAFDAYNNPNNLSIFPEQVTEFIRRGGKIVWGIIPTTSESVVRNIDNETIFRRLIATMNGLVESGVPAKLVYDSAVVSTQGDADHLSIIFAEKVLIMATQLVRRIPVVKDEVPPEPAEPSETSESSES